MGTFDTDNGWDDDDEQDGPEPTGNPNSSTMRQLRAADRAKGKRIKELEGELADLRRSGRDRSIKDVLGARGLNPKIAAFIPGDIEPNEDAVSKWLDEYGDLFGPAPAATSDPEPPSAADLRQMDSVMAGATVPANQEQMAQRIANASSVEELNAVIFGRQ